MHSSTTKLGLGSSGRSVLHACAEGQRDNRPHYRIRLSTGHDLHSGAPAAGRGLQPHQRRQSVAAGVARRAYGLKLPIASDLPKSAYQLTFADGESAPVRRLRDGLLLATPSLRPCKAEGWRSPKSCWMATPCSWAGRKRRQRSLCRRARSGNRGCLAGIQGA